jgi:hypothetical protein
MRKHTFLSRSLALACVVSLAGASHAQWNDRIKLGTGGESTVATDGQGNVFVTAHAPCEIFSSHDWGASFAEKKDFPDGFCDVHVYAWPNGRVNLSFIKPNVAGLSSYYSGDNGRTFKKGAGVDGPLDREWLAPNLTNGDLFMDYSHGYIGGPKSEGIFLALSHDGGKSFNQISKVDKEPAGDYAVDPYLVSSTDGKLYAMWSTSRDYNTIDRFDFAVSKDGGRTFDYHQNIGTLSKNLVDKTPKKEVVDTQERWILGCLASHGANEVLAIYPDFGKVTVDGIEYKPLLLYYKVSTDGGKSFGTGKTVSSQSELEQAIRAFEKNKKADTNYAVYTQTLPWACDDPYGRFHVAFQDNRSGQGLLGKDYFGKWQVRFASLDAPEGEFGPSERVSEDVICKRPPLDFLSCAADKKRAYVSWTQIPGVRDDMVFTGDLYVARKILKGQ